MVVPGMSVEQSVQGGERVEYFLRKGENIAKDNNVCDEQAEQSDTCDDCAGSDCNRGHEGLLIPCTVAVVTSH